ncbi:exportin-5 [Anaeramoeba flamelloides]|uniref:Exportin-5 n=1 Tax=Anaeramoeba flamelloides TaxID=1746091 RepID=A0ABQ8YIK1_9EUKA|nr:exportin-5 [Anaeramoeba flamelloides]
MIPYVQEMLQKEVTDEERSNLFEFLILLLTNSNKSIEDLTKTLNEILDPTIEKFNKENFLQIINNVNNLTEFLGIDKSLNILNSENEDEFLARRRDIYTMYSLVQKIFRSSLSINQVYYIDNIQLNKKKTITNHFVKIANSLGTMISNIDSLFNPEINSQVLHPDLIHLTGLFIDQYIHQVSENNSNNNGISLRIVLNYLKYNTKPKNYNDQMMLIILNQSFKYWLNNLRGMIYQIISSACTDNDEFYFVPDLKTFLKDYLFANIRFLNIIDLNTLINKILYPIFDNCPSQLLDSIICSLYPDLISFLIEKIRNEWGAYNKQINKKNENENNDEQNTCNDQDEIQASEVVYDQFLRTLTRSFLKFIYQISIKNEKNNHISLNGALTEVLLQTILISLNFPDKKSLSKTFLIISSVRNNLSNIGNFSNWFSSNLLQEIFKALANSKDEDISNDLVSLILKIFQLNNSIIIDTLKDLPNVNENNLQEFFTLFEKS